MNNIICIAFINHEFHECTIKTLVSIKHVQGGVPFWKRTKYSTTLWDFCRSTADRRLTMFNGNILIKVCRLIFIIVLSVRNVLSLLSIPNLKKTPCCLQRAILKVRCNGKCTLLHSSQDIRHLCVFEIQFHVLIELPCKAFKANWKELVCLSFGILFFGQ